MRGSLALPAALLLLVPAAALFLNATLGRPSEQALAAPVFQAEIPPQTPAGTAPAQSGGSDEQSPSPAPSGKAAPSGQQDASAPEPSAWEKAPLLQEAISKAMADFPGSYSVVVEELGTGNRWTLNPDQRYHPASTIKMPVVLYTLEQYRAGKVGWQDVIQYTPADFESPGGGLFETSPFGGWYPVENLVGRALRYSNNVAVNMLGRHFGWSNIEAWTATIDGTLYRVDGSPEVTAMSELGWWKHLAKLSREDPKSAELLLQPLREVAYDGRITAGLPEGIAHLHKFGSYAGYYHDGGIIYVEKPYILVVLTHGAREDEADAAIARISSEVYKLLGSNKL